MNTHSSKKLWVIAYLIYIITVSLVVGIEYHASLKKTLRLIDEKLTIAIKNIKYILPAGYHDVEVTPQEYRNVTRRLTEASYDTGFKFFYTVVKGEDGNLYEASSSEFDADEHPQYYSMYENPDPMLVRLLKEGKKDEVFFQYNRDREGDHRIGCIKEYSFAGKPFLSCADYDMSVMRRELRVSSVRQLIYYLLLLLCVYPFIWAYREASKFRQMQLEHDVRCRTAELGFALKTAERASQTKSNFLASMSHELRTPLNAILGFSEMMKEETFGKIGNTNYLDYIRYIHSSGEYLLSLINDILDLSRAESGKQRLEETLFPLCPRLRDFAGIVRFYPTAGEKEFRIDCSEDDIFLLADERLFKQIILNLLSNAIKFTNAGGHIWIKGEKRKDGSLQIEIKDDGIGIPADKIKTLFKPFSQVENILTKTHTGSGLGLSLVKRLMELHGGEAWLESEEGQGTRAYVLFPKERVFTKKKAEEKSKKDKINLLKDEKVGLN